ncbi:AI-2E family transporter [Sinisalibacter lacisalsi]|uniref:AI-2E family transporter n=1 Tax=Sinisalibacter lacisalsi TaxID=1526570 RepID=A0ABQ1QTI1_9RHOB|nr:AI-2E family transporter [Sinisalibacter lacisalsi]GGD42933.1 AI-2E family transporter [Sinisalibacter lacisalsi]
MKLSSLTYGTALAIMFGWLLWIGKPVLLPVLAAIIAIYVLAEATTWLAKLPVLRNAPGWLLRLILLLAFSVALFLLGMFITTSLARVLDAIPRYENNLDALVGRYATTFGIEGEPTWLAFQNATIGQVNTAAWIPTILNNLRGFGSTFFFIVLYASFLFAERIQFATKFDLATRDTVQRDQALALIQRINERVGTYLLVKTLINIILGGLSYLVLWAIGIEFALFWAILIAVLNYIPYVGSLIAVIFPVLLSLAQFGTLGMAAITLVTLTFLQTYVASFLEPRLMGRTFNLSPLVVLLALAFWTALWGLPGAILAVPLTSSLVIVLAEIKATRPFAIMLSANGRL